MMRTRPDLSIVVIFHDMKREAARTLWTMRRDFQQRAEAYEWEVIAIDNGSERPLSMSAVRSSHPTAVLHRIETDSVSPVGALNWGIRSAAAPVVMCVIDGARMLSPGVVARSLDLFQQYLDPFVATPSLHLGQQLQTDAVRNGYDQLVEDDLLGAIDWRRDGYQLFSISNLASQLGAVLSPLTESNCFAVRRDTLLAAGGFDQRFQSIGGGLANLELFERLLRVPGIVPISLLGEATFHQIHGGVTTNRSRKARPTRIHQDEYRNIAGTAYRAPLYKPLYVGAIDGHFRDALVFENASALARAVDTMVAAGRSESALGLAEHLAESHTGDPRFLELKARAQASTGRLKMALATLDTVLEIAPGRARLHVQRGRILRQLGRRDEATASFEHALTINPESGGAHFELGNDAHYAGDIEGARSLHERAVESEPRVNRFRLALAVHERLLGNPRRGADLLRQGLEYTPSDVGMRLELAACNRSANRVGEALVIYSQLARLVRIGVVCEASVASEVVSGLYKCGDEVGARELSAALRAAPANQTRRRNATGWRRNFNHAVSTGTRILRRVKAATSR